MSFPIKIKMPDVRDKVVTLKINCLRAWGCGSVGVFLPDLSCAFKDPRHLQHIKKN